MNTLNSTDDESVNRDPLYGISAALLRSEIGFWQDLIDSSAEPLAPEALERMEQALALAELKLKRMVQNSQPSAAKSGYKNSNVYSIRGHRV